MKTINLNKNSWHFKIYAYEKDIFELENNLKQLDFCSYVRNIIAKILGGIGILLICLLTLFIGFTFLKGLFFLLSGSFTSLLAYEGALFIIVSFVLIVFGLVFTISKLCNYIKTKFEEFEKFENKPKQDSFIKSAHSTFKDKVCYKITFK